MIVRGIHQSAAFGFMESEKNLDETEALRGYGRLLADFNGASVLDLGIGPRDSRI